MQGTQCEMSYQYTVKSGYLAFEPNGSTTATCALDNRARGLASITIPTLSTIMMPFGRVDSLITTCMHDIAYNYVHAGYHSYICTSLIVQHNMQDTEHTLSQASGITLGYYSS